MRTTRKEKKAVDKRRKAAREAGAFWLACPLCDQPFGGNEVYLDGTKSPWIEHQDLEGYGQLICPTCCAAGKGDQKFIQLFVDNTTNEE